MVFLANLNNYMVILYNYETNPQKTKQENTHFEKAVVFGENQKETAKKECWYQEKNKPKKVH